jgi:hypothetical protein
LDANLSSQQNARDMAGRCMGTGSDVAGYRSRTDLRRSFHAKLGPGFDWGFFSIGAGTYVVTVSLDRAHLAALKGRAGVNGQGAP